MSTIETMDAEEIRPDLLIPGDVLCHMLYAPGQPREDGHGWKRSTSRPAAWRVCAAPRRRHAGGRGERVFVPVEDLQRGGRFVVEFGPSARVLANLVVPPGRRGRRIE